MCLRLFLLPVPFPFGVYRLSLESKGFAPWSDIVEVHSEVLVNLAIT